MALSGTISRLRSVVHGARWWAWALAHNTGKVAAEEGEDPDSPALHAQIRRYYELTHHHYHLVHTDWRTSALHYGLAGHGFDGDGGHIKALRRTNEVMADALQLRPGMAVLDAGCGMGGSSRWMARERGVTVTGITLVPRQAELGAAAIEAEGLQGRVTLRVGDYDQTGLPAQSFDAVWALESFVHGPDKKATLREAYRLLKPGGRLAICDGLRGEVRPSVADAKLLSAIERGWSLASMATVSDYRRWLSEVGFDQVQTRDLSAAVQRSVRRAAVRCAAVVPAMEVGHRAGLIHAVERGNVWGSLAVWPALRRGAWTYQLIRARKPEGSAA